MADKDQRDRKAEIERRKKRLEELREARKMKGKEIEDKKVSNYFSAKLEPDGLIFVSRSSQPKPWPKKEKMLTNWWQRFLVKRKHRRPRVRENINLLRAPFQFPKKKLYI